MRKPSSPRQCDSSVSSVRCHEHLIANINALGSIWCFLRRTLASRAPHFQRCALRTCTLVRVLSHVRYMHTRTIPLRVPQYHTPKRGFLINLCLYDIFTCTAFPFHIQSMDRAYTHYSSVQCIEVYICSRFGFGNFFSRTPCKRKTTFNVMDIEIQSGASRASGA